MIKRFKKFKTGFTLIETLVALAIFSASVVALVSVTSSGIANTNFAKNKITASYLSQEGVELVRNARDTTTLPNGIGWNGFVSALAPACNKNQNQFGCNLDPLSQNILQSVGACGTSQGCQLHYRSDGFYVSFDGVSPASPFRRQIFIEEIVPGGELKVTATVFWQQGGVARSVSVSENLFNWTAPSAPPPPGPPAQ